jgi:hypothetical protein
MYIRYIHKLHDLHLAAENFSEAGFTMTLYADQLAWGMNTLPASPHFPAQPEWQRKEMIYRKIVHYFDKGKVSNISLIYKLQIIETFYPAVLGARHSFVQRVGRALRVQTF